MCEVTTVVWTAVPSDFHSKFQNTSSIQKYFQNASSIQKSFKILPPFKKFQHTSSNQKFQWIKNCERTTADWTAVPTDFYKRVKILQTSGSLVLGTFKTTQAHFHQ